MELWGQASIGKRQLIGDVNNVVSYTMSHDSADVLHRGSSGPSVIERISLIREETKGHACRYFKTMVEGINLAFHARVVIGRIAVEVAELGRVPL